MRQLLPRSAARSPIWRVLLAVLLVGVVAACGDATDTDTDDPLDTVPGTDDPADTTAPDGDGGTDTTADATDGGEEAETVRIGAIYPLTGSVAVDGISMMSGVEMAIDEINAAGGIESLGGAQLELSQADSEGSPEVAASEAERLIQDGVHALVGSWLSSNTLLTTQVAEREGIPHMVGLSVVDEIVERGFEYTFRITYGTGEGIRQHCELLDRLQETTGETVESIVYMHESSAYGASLADAWEQANADGDCPYELTERISYESDTPDLSTEVARAAATGADVLVSSGYRPDSVLLARTLAEQQVDFKGVIGAQSAAFYHPTFYDEVGAAANYLLDTNQGMSLTKPQAQEFADAWRENFDEEPHLGGIYSYTATYVLADALERAGSTDPEAIRDALSETEFPSDSHVLPQGPIVFDERGQNINARAVMYQWQDGESKILFPEEHGDGEPIFPVPAWSER